jgi:hypothetical protein
MFIILPIIFNFIQNLITLLKFNAYTEEYTYKDKIKTILSLLGFNLFFIVLSIFLNFFIDSLKLKNGLQIPIYLILCWIVYLLTNYSNRKIADYFFRRLNH